MFRKAVDGFRHFLGGYLLEQGRKTKVICGNDADYNPDCGYILILISGSPGLAFPVIGLHFGWLCERVPHPFNALTLSVGRQDGPLK